MATERYNSNDPEIDVRYFRAYADVLKPHVTGRVLDIGCGEGWLTKELAAIPAVISVEAVDKFSEQPEENYDDKITYIATNIVSDAFSLEHQYDTIISTEFIEHITQEDLEPLLVKIKAALKPGGIFLGSTPDKLSPTTNPYHLQEYTREELIKLFAEHGLVGTFLNPIRGLTVWITKSA